MQCLDFGVLMSEWPESKYTLEAVATFDEEINDGLADFAAGDYTFIYDVTVQKKKEGADAPSGINPRIDISIASRLLRMRPSI